MVKEFVRYLVQVLDSFNSFNFNTIVRKVANLYPTVYIEDVNVTFMMAKLLVIVVLLTAINQMISGFVKKYPHFNWLSGWIVFFLGFALFLYLLG